MRTLVLGREFSCREITSIVELIALVTEFSDMSICHGIRWTSDDVKTSKYGRKNILNMWQSVNCLIKFDRSICDECTQLEKALTAKDLRYVTFWLLV